MKEYKASVNVGEENILLNYVGTVNDADRSMVVFPGHMGSAASYKPLLKCLNAESKNYNYFCSDIAWGKSEITVKTYTKGHFIDIFSAFLEDVIRAEFPGELHLIGHSLGGELAIRLGMGASKKAVDGNMAAMKSITAFTPTGFPRSLTQFEPLDIFCRQPGLIVKILEKIYFSPKVIQNEMNKKLITSNISDEHATQFYNEITANDGLKRALLVQKEIGIYTKSKQFEDSPELIIPLQLIFGNDDKKNQQKIPHIIQG